MVSAFSFVYIKYINFEFNLYKYFKGNFLYKRFLFCIFFLRYNTDNYVNKGKSNIESKIKYNIL